MSVILFEDHTFARLKPLTWGQPTFEARCGLFNLRERVSLLGDFAARYLLCRAVMRPLLTDPAWETAASAPQTRALWLNGRIAPDAELLRLLVDSRARDWALHDQFGLLAASVAADTSAELFASWQTWERKAWEGENWEPETLLRDLPAPDLAALDAPSGLAGIWGLVPATERAISADLALLGEQTIERHSYGLFPSGERQWGQAGSLRRVAADLTPSGATVTGAGGLYLGSGDVDLAPGTAIDTAGGPVVLDSGVKVMPHCYLAGPLYLGRETLVKPGTRIFGETTCGVGNRLAGEIAESTFGDFVNKQHDGFIGHAVLGSWVNLGAATTCSDLKNNYSAVRVDLGAGPVATGEQFVGALIGDHTKTAIGTLLNTGTVVGFGCNVFGAGLPPKLVGNFSWGGHEGSPVTDVEKAVQTAEIVLGRRDCRWLPAHAELFRFLHRNQLR